MTTRKEYEKELEHLNHQIIRMGTRVEEMMTESIEALKTQDAEMAKSVVGRDDEVDNMERDIEAYCVQLIATQQPIAGDLRAIFAANKIVTDLERVADYAVNIALLAIDMQDETYFKSLKDIPDMGKKMVSMLHDMMTAYTDMNADLAYQVHKRDEEIDDYFERMFRELLTYTMEDARRIHQVVNFLFVVRYIERVADHIKNVCEWIIYHVTGVHIDVHPEVKD